MAIVLSQPASRWKYENLKVQQLHMKIISSLIDIFYLSIANKEIIQIYISETSLIARPGTYSFIKSALRSEFLHKIKKFPVSRDDSQPCGVPWCLLT